MKKKTKKNLLIIFLPILFIGIFALCFYSSYNYSRKKLSDTKKQNSNLSTDENSEYVPEVNPIDGITNILLLGADFRAGEEVARTDAMMVLTLDTINNKIKVTSLLRDVLVDIPGHGKSKLNHAFMWGGVDLLQETIKNNYKLNIDKYILIDFNGFKDVIDKLGGVKVDVKENVINELNKYIVDLPEDKKAKKIEKAGVQVLNGTQALAYSRIRYNTGDEYGRTQRQREIINSIMHELKSTSYFKYPSIIKSVMDNIETNLNFIELLKLGKTGLSIDIEDIQTLFVPFTELSIGGIYKHHGWVFRTDIDLTAKLLNEYIFLDKTPDLSSINKNELKYTE